jgi:hypothetical protein
MMRETDIPDSMPAPTQAELIAAAQSQAEVTAFIEAFAKVNVNLIRKRLGKPKEEAAAAEARIDPDWANEAALAESGISLSDVDDAARLGSKYLHIDVAMDAAGSRAVSLLLAFTGLSDKQRKTLFPVLSSQQRVDRGDVAAEVKRLNAWLDWVREGGFDPSAFVTYQRSIGIHGQTQNITGALGATGAAIAFVDVIQAADPKAIVDTVGAIPPCNVRTPQEVMAWRDRTPDATLKAVLLHNGRAVVFASSKDANIFLPLGKPYTNAAEALKKFNEVRNDIDERKQTLHEFAVGEVKTATDLANLHERMGLASRETQTELRTDRFLMMSVLNKEILEGGVQGRVMNNKDLVRFSHVFNLHHCWGFDGGRQRNSEHWAYFTKHVRTWCGL